MRQRMPHLPEGLRGDAESRRPIGSGRPDGQEPINGTNKRSSVTVKFDIVPRQALTPADFKALGRAIRRWLRLHAKQQGSVHWYDTDGLSDLSKGNPVRSPLGEETAEAFAPGDLTVVGGVGVLDPPETVVSRPICLSLIYRKDCDHRHVMGAVRRALPTELVADVLVEGRSWDDQDHGEWIGRSGEHTSELQSRREIVCRLLLEKKKKKKKKKEKKEETKKKKKKEKRKKKK